MNTLHKQPNKPKSSEITPESLYISRRRFLKTSILTASSIPILAACGPSLIPSETPFPTNSGPEKTDEMGDPITSYDAITHYNNYYEFSVDKQAVAGLSNKFTVDPWSVEIGGLVINPTTLSIDDIRKTYTQEERIYRLRCVEGWSMVIPWDGFSLSEILKKVEPTTDAKYVAFETVYRPTEMPGLNEPFYPWPYTEGLRLDEAMHPLTTVATGVYGLPLLPANGAPIRIVVPWKYGFKSIKSIVKITLTDKQPATLWNTVGPDEYGFYSNVNPSRSHPRWSQETERRIGEGMRRASHYMNGYAKQVASLYEGMDLMKEY